VVYWIPYECGKVYIGETGRSMQKRIKEHGRDIQLARSQTSTVSEHTENTGHHMLWNETQTGIPVWSRKLSTQDFKSHLSGAMKSNEDRNTPITANHGDT